MRRPYGYLYKLLIGAGCSHEEADTIAREMAAA